MNLPILIECRDGAIVNALHIAYLQPHGQNDCVIHLSVPRATTVNGQWSVGGAGSMSSYSSETCLYGGCSARDFMAKVNNALALVNMMEKSLVNAK